MAESDIQKSFLQNLWDRRFFQYLATYLGISWGLIQFLEWLVNRYNLNSSWVDNLVILLFAMLPGMAIFIYLHGRPGHDAWQPFEKILYPVNFVLALGASFLVFDGNATDRTRKIEVTNERGDTITRVVPSKEFTNRIVFFPFDSQLPEDDSWIEYGVPILSDLDIEQDVKWYSVRPTSLKEEYMDNGFTLGDEVPFSTKLQIASDIYCDFFVTGKLSKSNIGLKADINVYNAVNGKEVISDSFSGTDIYSLADQISSEIRDKINNVKLDKVETYIDLPSSDLISGNSEALKYFVLANLKYLEGVNSHPEALQLIQQSVNIDENCAECQSYLMVLQNAQGIDGKETIAKAIEKGANLPERQKLRFNYYNYQVNREPQKMVKLLEMWKNLYPQDIYPFEQLINYYSASLDIEKAEAATKDAMNNGHGGSVLLSAARINLLAKDFEEAESYINEYTEKYPKKAKNNILLGDIYIAKGEMQKALQIFEENSIINPTDVNIQIKAAEANYKLLNFTETEKSYRTALRIAKTPNDSLSVYLNMLGYYGRFGMEKDYSSTLNRHRSLYYRNFPRQGYITSLFQLGSFYTKIEGSNEIDKIEAEILDITPEFSKDVIVLLLNYLKALWKDDKEAYSVAYEAAKPLLSSSGGATVISLSNAIQSYYAEDYEEALKHFLEFEKITKAFSLEQSDLVTECFIKLGKLEEGLEHIETRLLRDSKHPLGLLSKLEILVEMGNKGEATELIDTLENVYALTSPKWTDKIKFESLKDSLAS